MELPAQNIKNLFGDMSFATKQTAINYKMTYDNTFIGEDYRYTAINFKNPDSIAQLSPILWLDLYKKDFDSIFVKFFNKNSKLELQNSSALPVTLLVNTERLRQGIFGYMVRPTRAELDITCTFIESESKKVLAVYSIKNIEKMGFASGKKNKNTAVFIKMAYEVAGAKFAYYLKKKTKIK